jgi:hypothetical protein
MGPGKSAFVCNCFEWLLTESFEYESTRPKHYSKGKSKEEPHVTELKTKKFKEAGNMTKGFLYVVQREFVKFSVWGSKPVGWWS